MTHLSLAHMTVAFRISDFCVFRDAFGLETQVLVLACYIHRCKFVRNSCLLKFSPSICLHHRVQRRPLTDNTAATTDGEGSRDGGPVISRSGRRHTGTHSHPRPSRPPPPNHSSPTHSHTLQTPATNTLRTPATNTQTLSAAAAADHTEQNQ